MSFKLPELPYEPAHVVLLPEEWDVDVSCTGAEATLTFTYDEGWLGGVDEADIVGLAHHEPGYNRWQYQAGAVDTAANTVTVAGVVVGNTRSPVERDLRENHIDPAATSLGVPVDRYLLDAMRRLARGGKWQVNVPGARLWMFAEGLHLVWPAGAEEVVSLLAADKVPGIPRDPDTLADILLMFLYTEVIAIIAVFYTGKGSPFIYPIFIAITAPPVQDRTFSANARAFNRWLVNDWLKGYSGDNVAVFDFYNVLTGPGYHHRFRSGRIEHVAADGRNTLYYPSDGDDHPSYEGNRKATDEIVPLINVYYHRWRAGPGSVQPVVMTPAAAQAAARPPRRRRR